MADLDHGQTYNFIVAAIRQPAGSDDFAYTVSDSVAATTTGTPATPTPVPPLGMPSGLTATASITPGRVVLRWTPGANATKHWVQGRRQSTQVVWTRTEHQDTYTVDGLSSGVQHRFRVTAGRGSEWSAWTAYVNVTPN